MKSKTAVSIVAMLLGAMTMGGVASATAPPTGNNDPITGAGPSGTLDAWPVCPVNTYVDQDTLSCAPLALQIPNGTEQLSTTATCPTDGELEGYFTDESQMPTLLECFLPWIEGWVDQVWAPGSVGVHPNNYLYFTASGGDGVTGCTFLAGTGPFYCQLDGNVYMDLDEVWQLYRDIGDLGPLIEMAHEVGHRFQHADQFNDSAEGDPTAEIPKENQADCVAGVFIDYLDRTGYLTPGDDAVDVAATMVWLGDWEESHATNERTHGDIDQRLRAFYTGLNSGWTQGVATCNQFVTDIPLAVPAGDVPQAPVDQSGRQPPSHLTMQNGFRLPPAHPTQLSPDQADSDFLETALDGCARAVNDDKGTTFLAEDYLRDEGQSIIFSQVDSLSEDEDPEFDLLICTLIRSAPEWVGHTLINVQPAWGMESIEYGDLAYYVSTEDGTTLNLTIAFMS